MSELKQLACEIYSVSIFHNLLESKPLKSLVDFLMCEDEPGEKMRLYGNFVHSLSPFGYSFSAFLKKAICEDENSCIVSSAKNLPICQAAQHNLKAELELFSRLTDLKPTDLWIDYKGYIPEFENCSIDFVKLYNERISNIDKVGYGIFATAGMFRVQEDKILPVESADPIDLDSFIGYESQRQQLMDNTMALAEGRPASNVLLFGDAGTGKSSSVKACANHFYKDGVRLIELRKDQLFSLSKIMGKIADNPLKFIIFIDDLSFNKNDDCFSMLKAALEGSASAKADNAVIYATSNRRHIVKEKFSDRETSDDIHHNDTVQELMSLSDRFGLTIYFSSPNKALYLDIVHRLAEQNSITMDKSELDKKAEAFALGKANRSPRAAKQFIKSLM